MEYVDYSTKNGYYVNAHRSFDDTDFKLYFTQVIIGNPIPGGNAMTNFTYRTLGTTFFEMFGQDNMQIGDTVTINSGGTITITAITYYENTNKVARFTYNESWKAGGNSVAVRATPIIGGVNDVSGDVYRTYCYNEYNENIGTISVEFPTTYLFTPDDYKINKFYGSRALAAYQGNFATGWGEFTDTQKNQMLGAGNELQTDSFLAAISKIGGGLGDYDITSDVIDEPVLPTTTPLDSRFFKIYAPTSANLMQLSTFLWSSDFADTVIKNLYQPIDAIINLYAVNFTPPITGNESAIVAGVATGVTMPRVSNMYTTIYCGELAINERWGSALDYAPYTKIQIFLPFIGCRDLAVDDVMGGTIKLTYNVDMLTGACVAIISTKRGDLDAVLYQFDGNLTAGIPVSGGGINFVYEAIQNSKGVLPAIASGNPAAMVMVASGAAMNTASSKAQINKAGSMGGSNGVLGIKKPYLIITRPEQSLAKNYNKFRGFPSNITAVLSTLSGYTEIEEIHLENMGATITKPETAEIERLLKEGVIL